MNFGAKGRYGGTHVQGKRFTDTECYQKLVHIIYYAGFTANTVTKKSPQ